MCILSVYTLLNVVGYYDLSVLSMSVMVSKKSLDGFELYPIFLNLFNFAKPLIGVPLEECDGVLCTTCGTAFCWETAIREFDSKLLCYGFKTMISF